MPTVEVFGILARKATTVRAGRGVHYSAKLPVGLHAPAGPGDPGGTGRAWAAGAGPGDDPLTINLDSTVCETFGLAKECAQRHNYAGTGAPAPGPS